MNRPTRLQIGLLAALVVVMIVLVLRDWNNYTIGIFLDDGMYVVLAESLVRGTSYGWFFMPAALQATQLPFGMPLLLAPLTAWFPDNYDLLRLVPPAASVLNLNLLFWGWRRLARGFSYWWCLALVALLAVSPLTILFARVVMSEAPFLTWSLIAILVTERLASKTSRWDAVWFGLVSLGLIATRTIGWLILGTLVLYLSIKLRREVWRPLAVTGLTFLACFGLLTTVTVLQFRDLVPSSYLASLATYANGIQNAPKNETTEEAGIESLKLPPSTSAVLPAPVSNLLNSVLLHLDFSDWMPKQIETEIRPILDGSRVGFLRLIPGLLLIALVLYGGVGWYRTSGLAAFWFVTPPYLLSLVIWQWHGSRLFYPVQPQLLIALMLGVYGVSGQGAGLFTNRALSSKVLMGFVLAAVVLAELALDLRSGTWFLPKDLRGADVQWISQETSPDVVVLTSEPITYYLYVHRQFVPLPTVFKTDQDLVQQIRAFDVNYVIAHTSEESSTDPGHGLPTSEGRLGESTSRLAKRGVLVSRFVATRQNVTIFQVVASKLALEPQ